MRKSCNNCVYIKYEYRECHDKCDCIDSPYFGFHVGEHKEDVCDCWDNGFLDDKIEEDK